MRKSSVLNITSLLLTVLGIAIIYLGVSAPKIIWPPIITGIGFFIISLALHVLKK